MPKPSPSQKADCALLVLSCDPYADLWPPFFALLHRYWADCPFPIFLGTGESAIAPNDVRLLRSNGERDWSKCVFDYLEALEQPYVLIMLDDFFLRHAVPTTAIIECLEFARAHHVTQLRLIPRPGPTDRLPGEKSIGHCAVGSPYRLCIQAAIWDRVKLQKLLRAGESIWEFEHNGNVRAALQPEGFFSVRKSVLPYEGCWAHHVIEKGKWLPHEKWIFARQNIGCDFSRRGTLPWSHTLFYHLARTLDRLLDLLPWRTKAHLKRRLKAVLRPFLGRALDTLGQTPARSRPVK